MNTIHSSAPKTNGHRLLPATGAACALVLAILGAASCASEDSVGDGGLSSNNGDGGEGGSGASGGSGPGGGASGGQGGTGNTMPTTSSGGGGTGGMSGCVTNVDCAATPETPVCNAADGECVACTPQDDVCIDGQYCEVNNTCKVGCTDEADCPGDTVCDASSNNCVNCGVDTDCPPGSICAGATCVEGCSGIQPCQVGTSCCGNKCFDLSDDADHCGTCTNDCEDLANSVASCDNGVCEFACNSAWADCNGDLTDGCENNLLRDGPCACSPGTTQSCYFGAPGSVNVGPCKAGMQTCNGAGTGWSACMGQVLPNYEICSNGIDENCDGTLDNGSDLDGDGWSYCDGDCCDFPSAGCTSGPAYINPGALEIIGNATDDDCDPGTSDTIAPAACSSSFKLTGVTPQEMAAAMELCQTTTASPPMPQKKWGIVSASFLLPGGGVPNATQLANIQNWQTQIATQYGNTITPHTGPTMGGMSTGRMRYTSQTGFVVPNGGTQFGPSTCPAAYLAANGGSLPSSAGCSAGCPPGVGCNDGVNLRLQVRTPTNAQGFSYDFRFFSAEYPEYLCMAFNDFYLALLTSGAPAIPADKNVSFDAIGNALSVNNGFFDVCQPASCFTCPGGTGPLLGTGMEGNVGGGTQWLTTDAPIVPGETITLDLMVFDVGDQGWDSLTLLDNFSWSLVPVTLGTHE